MLPLSHHFRLVTCAYFFFPVLLFGSDAHSHERTRPVSSAEQAWQDRVTELESVVERLQKAITNMENQDPTASPGPATKPEIRPSQNTMPPKSPLIPALDRAMADLALPRLDSRQPGIWRKPLGRRAQLRLIDLSVLGSFYAGGASERDATTATINTGGHGPKNRGFTLGQIEFSLAGAVDPYFTAETHFLALINPQDGETTIELEEAFATTTALPYGLQVEFGQIKTEFGIVNPQHSHSWDWIDQPVINSRLFGTDGLRQAGFRASWLTPTPWYSVLSVGVQNADGANMLSFLGGENHDHGGGHGHEDEHDDHGEDEHGAGLTGRPIVRQDVRRLDDFLYLARWNHSVNLTNELTGKFGLSGLYGPNSTGRDGDTWVYGADTKWTWTPQSNFRGYPFLTWQAEIMKRDYHASKFIENAENGDFHGLSADTVSDWGLYTQLLYGFHTNWAAGLRYEYATGTGQGPLRRKDDPNRDTRHRLSPLLVWSPSEFTRIRLQYNFDKTDHMSKDTHSLWFGFEWLYGAHPAHNF